MRVIQSKVTKTNPDFFSKRGRRGGGTVLDPPLGYVPFTYVYKSLFMNA